MKSLWVCVLAVGLALAGSGTAKAATIYAGPGTYTPADNCGFSAPDGATHGWINVMLLNDSDFHSLWVAPGVFNNLRIKQSAALAGTRIVCPQSTFG